MTMVFPYTKNNLYVISYNHDTSSMGLSYPQGKILTLESSELQEIYCDLIKTVVPSADSIPKNDNKIISATQITVAVLWSYVCHSHPL